MLALNAKAWKQLPKEVERSNYDRAETQIGLVHLGPGAFHRAHQAYYTDLALELGGDWGISAVSMNSTGVVDALRPQNGLYTLAIQDIESSYRVIGSINEVLHLASDREAVVSRLCAVGTKVVTLTVTEKGYILDEQGNLQRDHPSIQHDLASPSSPKTIIGLLTQIVEQRASAGLAPLTIISCDNVSDNGDKLRKALLDFAQLTQIKGLDLALQQQHYPNTMVDCITPASDSGLSEYVANDVGIKDAWPIKRERFSQWVIEDLDGMDLPPWREVGVTFTNNIQAYENAKLRILNLAHSALAYLGPVYGCETVYQAISRHELREFIDQLLQREVIPQLEANAGDVLNHQSYKLATIARFENPHIKHLLAQIAHDGSQKLAIRAIPVLRENLQSKTSVQGICELLVAWANHVFTSTQNAEQLIDPQTESLTQFVRGQTFSAASVIALLKQANLITSADLSDGELESNLETAFAAFQRRLGCI